MVHMASGNDVLYHYKNEELLGNHRTNTELEPLGGEPGIPLMLLVAFEKCQEP